MTPTEIITENAMNDKNEYTAKHRPGDVFVSDGTYCDSHPMGNLIILLSNDLEDAVFYWRVISVPNWEVYTGIGKVHRLTDEELETFDKRSLNLFELLGIIPGYHIHVVATPQL